MAASKTATGKERVKTMMTDVDGRKRKKKTEESLISEDAHTYLYLYRIYPSSLRVSDKVSKQGTKHSIEHILRHVLIDEQIANLYRC